MKIKTFWNTTPDETAGWSDLKITAWFIGQCLVMAALIVVPVALWVGR